MSNTDDDLFECFTCKRQFRGGAFNTNRAIEHTEFVSGRHHGCSHEVVTHYAEAFACYCSNACRSSALAKLMQEKEGISIPATSPGLGPVETCAKCRGPVHTSKPHWAYYVDEIDVSGPYVKVLDLDYVAVLCPTCKSPSARAAETEELEQPTPA